MIFHENSLLADDSHVLPCLIFLKIGKMSQNLSSAAVMIGPLRVKLINQITIDSGSDMPYYWSVSFSSQ